MQKNNIDLNIGDVVIMKKNHACGENRWLITRVGVDIKMKCLACNHEVMLERISFNKKFKKKEGGSNG